MAQAYNITDPTNPGAAATMSVDKSGNVSEAGTLTLSGPLILAQQAAAPTAQPSTTTLYGTTGGALAITDPAGVNTTTFSTTGIKIGGNQVRTDPPSSVTTQGALADTIPPWACGTATALTSGTLGISSIWLPSGTTIGHIGFATGTTAANGPTHWWAALLDNAFKVQAISADQTSGAIAASTWFSLATNSFTTTYTGRYYLGLLITVGTTMPTMVGGAAPLAAVVTGTGAPTPLLGGSSTTGLTTPGTAGSTVYIAPTAATPTPYLYAAA